jgi:hypothetical protein
MPTLPPAAALVDRLVVEAVDAAARQAPQELDTALDRLAAVPAEHPRRLLSTSVRAALERHHPDGVAGEDLVALTREVAGACPARPVDAFAIAVVLTGVFGIEVTPAAGEGDSQERPDDVAPPDPAGLTRHAVLVLAQLAPARRELRSLLDAAWSEIARADANDG